MIERSRNSSTWLITGGCGFIGSNMAARRHQCGDRVVVLDDLSRPGSALNRDWLVSLGVCEPIVASITDYRQISQTIETVDPDVILHCAAQVAVTRSIDDPLLHFQVNALGTLNVLECARLLDSPPAVLFSSTNKVYGELATGIDPTGVTEMAPLDFHSPYGCSKGAADQYVRDYWRIYGLPTVVFRQSCCYGPRQFGTEDQGWVAHFAFAAATQNRVIVYGDGCQIRDCLWIDDLLDIYDRAWESLANENRSICGEVFNVGGGPERTLCPNDLIRRFGLRADAAPWRPGDQRAYVSDVRKAKQFLDWRPTVGVDEGIERLCEWVASAGRRTRGTESPGRAPARR
jgi:CDP-paratose 2-epimerase